MNFNLETAVSGEDDGITFDYLNENIVSKGNNNSNNNSNNSSRLPIYFSIDLSQLLETVATDEKWDLFHKEYLWNINKLEIFLENITH